MILVKASFRPLAQCDYEAYLELNEEVDLLHREGLPKFFRKADSPFRTREYFNGLLVDPKTLLMGAVMGEKLAGFAHAMIKEHETLPIRHPRRYVLIDNLVVASSDRGTGIGRALIVHVQNWAKSEHISEIELNVYEFNQSAIRFYEAMGFLTSRRYLSAHVPWWGMKS